MNQQQLPWEFSKAQLLELAQTAIDAGNPLVALDYYVAAGVRPPDELLASCTDWLNVNKPVTGTWTVEWNEWRPRFTVTKHKKQR